MKKKPTHRVGRRPTYKQREAIKERMQKRISKLEERAIATLTELAGLILPGGEARQAGVGHEPGQRRLVENALSEIRLFRQGWTGRA